MDGEEAAGREDGGGRDRGAAESGKGGKKRGRGGSGWASEVRRMFNTERKKCTHILLDATRLV